MLAIIWILGALMFINSGLLALSWFGGLELTCPFGARAILINGFVGIFVASQETQSNNPIQSFSVHSVSLNVPYREWWISFEKMPIGNVVNISLWIPLAILALSFGYYCLRLARRRYVPNTCVGCEYPLEGYQGVTCPECGKHKGAKKKQ